MSASESAPTISRLAPRLPRTALVQRVQREAARHRLIWLVAPPGSGKSTLLNAVSTDATALAALVVLHSDDGPIDLLAALHTALALPPLPSDLPPRLVLHFTLDALRTLMERTPHRAVLLLIDDLDRAPSVQPALLHLLEQAPASLHCVIAAASEPESAQVVRWQAEGTANLLRAPELYFSLEETGALLTVALGRKPAPTLVENVEIWFGGWPLGVGIVASVLAAVAEHGEPFEPAKFVQRHPDITRPIAAFLEQEVLQRQPPALRTVLLTSALGATVDAGLCAALGCQDAQRTLAVLQRQSLFLQKPASPNAPPVYLPFFRQFLSGALAAEIGDEALRHLHRLASDYYVNQAEWLAAIDHMLEAADFAAAATLLPTLYRDTLVADSFTLVQRWLERFPHRWRDGDAWLLLLRAQVEAQEGDPDRADALYAAAGTASTCTAGAGSADDADALRRVHFIALRERADWLRQCARYTEAEHLCADAITLAPDDEQRALVLAIEARCVYMRGGDPDRALHIIDRALELARKAHVRATTVRIITMQGSMRFNRGDFSGALDSYHEALEMKTQLGQRLRATLGNIAYLHTLRGELDLAEAAAQRARTEAVKDAADEMTAYAEMVLGMVEQHRGRFDAARAWLNTALSKQRQLDNQTEVAVVLDCLGQLAVCEQDFAAAVRYGENSLSIRRALGVAYEIGLAQISLGRTYALIGETEKAHMHWEDALAIFVAAGACYEQAQLHFFLAWLSTTTSLPGPHQAGLEEHLCAALTLSARYDYRRLFVEDVTWAVPVLVEALRRDICLEHTVELMAVLGAEGTTAALTALLAHQDTEHLVVQQAIRRATQVWLAHDPPPLHVTTLGSFRLYRGEQLVTDWSRASARLLFLYLLHHRQRWTPTDELLDVLWPEINPDKARKSLHQASAALRRALEPELGSGLPSRYLLIEPGNYRLRLPPGSTVDHEMFAAKAHTARHLDALIEAAALYQGDYLAELPDAEWALARREQLRLDAMDVLGHLCAAYFGVEQIAECIHTAQRLLEIEPWSEQAVYWLMRGYQQQGRRDAALRIYQSFAARLHDELAILPQSELRALYQSIANPA